MSDENLKIIDTIRQSLGRSLYPLAILTAVACGAIGGASINLAEILSRLNMIQDDSELLLNNFGFTIERYQGNNSNLSDVYLYDPINHLEIPIAVGANGLNRPRITPDNDFILGSRQDTETQRFYPVIYCINQPVMDECHEGVPVGTELRFPEGIDRNDLEYGDNGVFYNTKNGEKNLYIASQYKIIEREIALDEGYYNLDIKGFGEDTFIIAQFSEDFNTPPNYKLVSINRSSENYDLIYTAMNDFDPQALDLMRHYQSETRIFLDQEGNRNYFIKVPATSNNNSTQTYIYRHDGNPPSIIDYRNYGVFFDEMPNIIDGQTYIYGNGQLNLIDLESGERKSYATDLDAFPKLIGFNSEGMPIFIFTESGNNGYGDRDIIAVGSIDFSNLLPTPSLIVLEKPLENGNPLYNTNVD